MRALFRSAGRTANTGPLEKGAKYLTVSGTCRPFETGTVKMRIMQDSATVSQTAQRIQRPELPESLIRRTYLELRWGAIRSEAMERDRHAWATAKKIRVGAGAKTVDASMT